MHKVVKALQLVIEIDEFGATVFYNSKARARSNYVMHASQTSQHAPSKQARTMPAHAPKPPQSTACLLESLIEATALTKKLS